MKLKTRWLLPADRYERIFKLEKTSRFASFICLWACIDVVRYMHRKKKFLHFLKFREFLQKAAPKNVHEERGWDNTSKTLVDT